VCFHLARNAHGPSGRNVSESLKAYLTFKGQWISNMYIDTDMPDIPEVRRFRVKVDDRDISDMVCLADDESGTVGFRDYFIYRDLKRPDIRGVWIVEGLSVTITQVAPI
jgi:hypothetical protein